MPVCFLARSDAEQRRSNGSPEHIVWSIKFARTAAGQNLCCPSAAGHVAAAENRIAGAGAAKIRSASSSAAADSQPAGSSSPSSKGPGAETTGPTTAAGASAADETDGSPAATVLARTGIFQELNSEHDASVSLAGNVEAQILTASARLR
jgi:hypothetical protein